MPRSRKQKFVRKTKQRVGCQECGKEGPIRKLHFHHLDSESKVVEVSRMNRSSAYTFNDLKNEIKKCKIVCQKCHLVAHDTMHTREDYIDALEYVAEKIGKSPTNREYREWKRDTYPSPTTIADVFGSWNDAKKASDLKTVNEDISKRETGLKSEPDIVVEGQSKLGSF